MKQTKSVNVIRNFFNKVANIKSSSDVDKTISDIHSNISVKGYNVWLLICSALLASIGLDTNSTAVIIGAMLISPLMSPILGLGLSVGIHDNDMFRHSIRNLIIATFVSLGASFLYFLISPFGELTSEILSRTKPTSLDIGIAFFGGVAGIVSASRKDTTTAIPGVAIATALMPPLCSAGFGLAKGNLPVFFGAFYLFIINAVFISLATFLIVKYLKFPVKQYVDKLIQKKYSRYASITIILLLLPSIYFLITVYQEVQFKSKIQNVIVKDLEKRKNEVLKWIVSKHDSTKEITFYLSGKGVSDADKVYFVRKFKELGLKDYKPVFSRVNISKEEVAKLSTDITENLLKGYEMQLYSTQKSELKDKNNDSLLYDNINKDLRVLNPDIKSISIGEVILFNTDSTKKVVTSATIAWNKQKRRHQTRKDEDKFYDYMKLKLKKDTLILNNIY